MSHKPFISLLLTYPVAAGLSDLIAEIPLDVCRQRNYKFGAEVTSFPVDDGSEITDHVRLLPDEISLEGMVSDAPVSTVSTVPLDLRGDTSSDRVPGAAPLLQSAYDVLTKAFKERQPITVVTEFQVFEDMIMTSLDVPRATGQGAALMFSLSLKHISVVSTATATLPSSIVARLKRKARDKSKNKGAVTRAVRLQEQVEKGQIPKEDAKAQIAAATKAKVTA